MFFILLQPTGPTHHSSTEQEKRKSTAPRASHPLALPLALRKILSCPKGQVLRQCLPTPVNTRINQSSFIRAAAPLQCSFFSDPPQCPLCYYMFLLSTLNPD